MVVLKDFELKVLVDDVAAEEFDDDDGAKEASPLPNTISRYIEAKSGAEFSLEFRTKPSYHFTEDFLKWEISLNGKWASGPVMPRSYFSKRKGHKDKREGVTQGSGEDWTIRKFKFADIETRENMFGDDKDAFKSIVTELGSISVLVWRCKQRTVTPANEASLGGSKIKDLAILPEKALKGRALSLSTSLGTAQKYYASTVWSGDHLDDCPVAISRSNTGPKALQGLLIIPRTPSPVPLEERPVEELTAEEARELVRRTRAREAAIKQERMTMIKRERSSTVGTSGPRKIAYNSSSDGYVNLYSGPEDDHEGDPDVDAVSSSPAKKSRPAAEIGVINLAD